MLTIEVDMKRRTVVQARGWKSGGFRKAATITARLDRQGEARLAI